MRRCLTLSMFLLFGGLYAQITITISDQTESGFLLGIDGFAQNAEPQKVLSIRNLDTSQHTLNFRLSDSVETEFQKKIKFRSGAQYKYVITTNFKGKVQLRYRGKFSSSATSGTVVDFNTDTPWQPKDTLPLIASIEKPVEKPVETKDSVASETTVTAVASVDTVETAVPEPVKATPKSIDVILAEMDEKKYEFDRFDIAKKHLLEQEVSCADLVKILKKLKFDQTRYELLSKSLDRISDKDNSEIILDAFEFEISKKRAGDILKKL